MRPGKWLNDEIINAYVRLINMRKASKGYVLNTFFYTMLENMSLNKDYKYEKLSRVLKKQKITSLSNFPLTLIPVNIRHTHWLLLVLDPKLRQISVLDSMGPASSYECETYLQTLEPFLRDHFTDQDWSIFSLAVPL